MMGDDWGAKSNKVTQSRQNNQSIIFKQRKSIAKLAEQKTTSPA
jgi:hypothetical protein